MGNIDWNWWSQWLVKNAAWVVPAFGTLCAALGYFIRVFVEALTYTSRKDDEEKRHKKRLQFEERRELAKQARAIMSEGDSHGYVKEPRDQEHIIAVITDVTLEHKELGHLLNEYLVNWIIHCTTVGNTNIEALEAMAELRADQNEIGEKMLVCIKEMKEGREHGE